MHSRRLESRILAAMHRANRDYTLIRPGDRILVALSGGKDSYAMLWGLRKMQAAAPFDLHLVGYHLDQGQPGHDVTPIAGHLDALDMPYEIEVQDTYTRVVAGTEPGKIFCSLCSRFRRAILYKAAARNGCNKVALGHHADDLIETLLLNIFYSGQLKSMPPKLLSRAGTHELIRPLVYVPEKELIELSQQHEFPIVPCRLCGSMDSQRVFVKGLLEELSQRSHHIKGNILNSLANVKPSHLMDKALHPWFEPDATASLNATAPLDEAATLEIDEESDEDVDGCAPTPPLETRGLPLVS